MRDRWSEVSALADVSRRALYRYVRHQTHPVSREEAAAATGISRNLAAFHLDKLVDAGVLTAAYQAPPDQPRGRGRSPKVYRPAGDAVTVTIPERRYELIAEILAGAVATDPAHADLAASRRAHQHGHATGARLAAAGTDLPVALENLGYEPRAEHPTGHPAPRREEPAPRLLLDNCPFHALATRHTALVCGINHAFLSGLLDGMGADDVRARLAPRPGACCVELVPAPGTAAEPAAPPAGRTDP